MCMHLCMSVYNVKCILGSVTLRTIITWVIWVLCSTPSMERHVLNFCHRETTSSVLAASSSYVNQKILILVTVQS